MGFVLCQRTWYLCHGKQIQIKQHKLKKTIKDNGGENDMHEDKIKRSD